MLTSRCSHTVLRRAFVARRFERLLHQHLHPVPSHLLGVRQAPAIQDIFHDPEPREFADVALRCGGESLTHADTRRMTESIASLLRPYGAQVVAVHMTHSEALMLPLLLGILRTGSSFLILDGSGPEHMEAAQRCGASLVVASHENAFMGLDGAAVVLAHQLEAAARELSMAAETDGADAEMCSSLQGCTSAITEALPAFPEPYRDDMTQHYKFTSGACMIQCSEESPDIFIEEGIPFILAGGSIEMLPKHVLLNQDALQRAVRERAATHMTVSTALFDTISSFSLPGLQAVIVVGESMRTSKQEDHYQRFQRVHPTTSIFQTSHFMEAASGPARLRCIPTKRELPMGKAVRRARTYVRSGGRLWSMGMPDEVHVDAEALEEDESQCLPDPADAELREQLWRLNRIAAASGPESNRETNYGSLGHPDACRTPCINFARDGKCAFGATCARCHLCVPSSRKKLGPGKRKRLLEMQREYVLQLLSETLEAKLLNQGRLNQATEFLAVLQKEAAGPELLRCLMDEQEVADYIIAMTRMSVTYLLSFVRLNTEEQRFAWKQLRMRLTTDAAIGPMSKT
ncbi:Bacitracin synthase 1 [Symbiodinium microadriaticum]|uniref:Bacitracin synthase 1 n=1 Tax=Symbiodinium microadriaticum TaxID=2951 RepID=A0A1Q9E4L2_SYMMI|nr:Bacitracin synthase 1 [Symbiodinium microadriaticum]